MQQIEPAPAARAADQQRTLRLAWLTLLGFFLIFAVLLGSAGLAVRDLYRTATLAHGATLFLRGPAEAIVWRPAARTIFQGGAEL